jgi:hypothetical protein
MMLMILPGSEVYEQEMTPENVEPMLQYNASLAKAGVLITVDGLQSPAKGARVTFPGGKATVTDGPYAEAKELLGGFWIIDVKSKEEAVEWASRCPAREGETVEVRQVQEIDDFPAELREVVTRER